MARFPLPPAEPMRLVSLAEIARGGMGSVELARVEGGKFNKNLLAIKRLHPNIAQDPQFVGMFLDEAWMTAALKSPNVVQVAAWGNDEKGMFLAVEFVQGVSLSRLIKESQTNQEPFAERTVANIGSQICAGLVAAHGLRGPDNALLGLVHRDLTPGNILVSFEGVVKIADFGIAKAEERITHTRTGTLKGKPSYMAPEQARGGKVDARSDLFSFGVLLFELLAGRRPWMAKSAFDVMMDIATTPPPDLRELRKGVNPAFVEIVEKCLAKKPEDRFSSATEIQQQLDGWRQQKNFVHDDLRSLGQFVVRNSAAQIKWFEDAMQGEMQRAQKLSFKELEEQIDLERETTAARRGGKLKTMPARPEDAVANPRSSQHALPAPSRISVAGQPQAGSGQYGAVQMPLHQRPPSSGNMQAVRPSGQSGSNLAAVQPPSVAYGAPSSASPASPASPKNLGGTEFMAQSPFGSPVPQAGQLPQPPPPKGAGTMLMPVQSQPQVPDPRSSQPGRPPGQSSLQDRMPLQDRMSSQGQSGHGNIPSPMPAGPSGGPTPPPQPVEATVFDPALLAQLNQRNAALDAGRARNAPESSKRGGGGLAIALLVLLLFGAGAAAAWYFRAEIAPAQFAPKRHSD